MPITGFRRGGMFRSAALIVFLVGASCDGATSTTGQPLPDDTPGAVTSVTVSPASLMIFIGGTTKLSAVARDASGTVVSQATVTWSSSNPSIASVASDGTVTGRGVGNVTVTASSGAASGASSVGVQAPPVGSGDVTVNAGITYQTMRGWEAHTQSAHEHPSYPQFQNELMNRAVNELGINRVRLEMWSGTEQDQDYYSQWLNGQLDNAGWRCKRFATVNDNGDPFSINWSGFHFSKIDKEVNDVVKPLQQRLQARGEQLHVNLLYDAFTNQICGSGDQYVHDNDPEEFAEFVLANFLHLRNQFGIVPQSFELLLEPENSVWWTKGGELGDALVATMARLNANGFNPRVIAPSVAFARDAEPFLDDMGPAATSLIDELSFHAYDGPGNVLLGSIAARAASMAAETSMLEHIGDDHLDLYRYLTVANLSAFQQFALAFWHANPNAVDRGGAYYRIDTSAPGSPVVNLSSRARFLSQYFKYVREGAVRLGAVSSTNGVSPVAFLNTDGKMVMVANISGAKSFSVGGLSAGTYDVTYTTSSVLQASGGSVTIAAGQELPVSVPAAGVVTLSGR